LRRRSVHEEFGGVPGRWHTDHHFMIEAIIMSTVPPPIDTTGTSPIGLSMRETVILAAGAVIVLLVFTIPIPFYLKLGLAVVVGGLAALFAIGRGRGGKKVEDFLRELLGYTRRDKLLQRGATRLEKTVPDIVPVVGEAEAPDQFWLHGRLGGLEDAILKLPALPLSAASVLSVFAVGFLVMLLAWIWAGGLQTLSVWFNAGF
jgi:hypothetical protein